MGNESLTFGEAAMLIRETVQPKDLGSMPYIGLEHIEEGSLRLNGFGKAKDVTSTKFKFSRGDVLFGKLRPYFRKVIRAPFDGVCSTDIWVVRATPNTNHGYLYYWMASKPFVDFATRGSEGTRMPRAKWEHVSRYEQTRLPMDEQRAIAHILGSLDDKIELNRQMNETLEAMARAIFKSWFVDFDPVKRNSELRIVNCEKRKQKFHENSPFNIHHSKFDSLFPDSFQDSDLGEIPKGWKAGVVLDLGEVICGKTPPTKDPDNYGEDISFITIPDMHGKVFVTQAGKYLSTQGAKTQPKKFLPSKSICVSCIATPGLVILTSEKSQTNQQINSVIPEDYLSPYYCFQLLRRLGDQIRADGSGGSVLLNLNKTQFSRIKILLAEQRAIEAYHKLVKPLFDQLLSNERESATLASLRDALLPKLISGELRVPDAEKFVEEARV